MQPYYLRLSLLAQKIQKTIHQNWYSEAAEAQEIGKQIFGIEIPFLLDRSGEVRTNKLSPTHIETLGEYVWQNDVMRIYYNRIKSLCSRYNVNFNSHFLFCFCHEIGHAKEDRLFEEAGYFPNTFRVWRFGIPIKIESNTYDLSAVSLEKKQFFDIFSCGIHDFAIDSELEKHGIKDALSRRFFFDTKKVGYNKDVPTDVQRHKLILDSLLLLPKILDIHEHGELSENEQRTMRENYEEIIGEKWDGALKILKNIEILNPQKTVEIMLALFEKILGVHAISIEKSSESIFADHPILPRFWNKDSYRIILL